MNRPALVAATLFVGTVSTACPPLEPLRGRSEPANFRLPNRGDEARFVVLVIIPAALADEADLFVKIPVDPVPQPEPADTSARLLGTISLKRPVAGQESGEFALASIRGQSMPKPLVPSGTFQGEGEGPPGDLELYTRRNLQVCEETTCTVTYYVSFLSLADIPIEGVWSVNAGLFTDKTYDGPEEPVVVSVRPFAL